MVEINDAERMKRAIASLRGMLRDKKELNRLLLGAEESSDTDLAQCIIQALIDWNTSPPHLAAVSLRDHPNKFLLLQGAAVSALSSAGLWHSREHMPSSEGGTSADDHAKAGEYSAWIERYVAEYERKKSDMKAAMNIAAALGNQGVMSEYGLHHYGMGESW